VEPTTKPTMPSTHRKWPLEWRVLACIQALRENHEYDLALSRLKEAQRLEPCHSNIAKEMKELEE